MKAYPVTIEDVVRRAIVPSTEIQLVSEEEALFTGFTKTGTVPVKVNKLQRVDVLIELHNQVCAGLDALGVRYMRPQFVKTGYQPHVTQHHEQAFLQGSRQRAEVIDLIESAAPEYGNPRLVVSRIELPSE